MGGPTVYSPNFDARYFWPLFSVPGCVIDRPMTSPPVDSIISEGPFESVYF